MPESAGHHGDSSSDPLPIDNDLRQYLKKSTEDLGEAYNQIEDRIHDVERDIDEQLKPKLRDVQDRAATLVPRVDRLEQLIGPYHAYESDVRKAVKKMKAIEEKVELTLNHPRSPSYINPEHVVDKLTTSLTALASNVERIGNAVLAVSDAQQKMDGALRQAITNLEQKVNSILPPAVPLADTVPSESPAEAAETPSTTLSVNDVGRDLLNRLSLGQEIDRGLLQHLAARFLNIAPWFPLSPTEPRRPEIKTTAAESVPISSTTNEPRASGSATAERSTLRKRDHHQEAKDTTSIARKKQKIPHRTSLPAPITKHEKAPSIVSTDDEQKPPNPRRLRASRLRRRTRSHAKRWKNDDDIWDIDKDEASGESKASPPPPPRRTARAVKPTERARDSS